MTIKLAAQQSDGSGIVIVEANSPFNDNWKAEREEHLALHYSKWKFGYDREDDSWGSFQKKGYDREDKSGVI